MLLMLWLETRASVDPLAMVCKNLYTYPSASAGTIPPAWGADGSLGALTLLQLAANLLNGTIPQM